MGKDVFVLDIGSGKLACALGHKTSGGIYEINKYSELKYDGYYCGKFVNPDNLQDDFSNLFSKANLTKKIKTIYVSVPSEFIKICRNNFFMDFGKEKYITSKTIDLIHDEANDYNNEPGYTVISSSAVNYTLDETIKTLDPIGERASMIRLDVSYILADIYFLNTIDYVLNQLGVKNIEYTCSSLNTGTRYISERERINKAVLFDFGFASSSCSVFQGNALVYSNTISLGSANIYFDLSNIMNVYFEEAQSLEKHLNLYSVNDDSLLYSVNTENGVKRFRVSDVNECIKNRLNDVAAFINDSLTNEDNGIPSDAVLYVTGGGFTNIVGAMQYIEQQIKRNLKVVVVDIRNFDKPYYTSLLSLFDVAGDMNESNSIWNKLF